MADTLTVGLIGCGRMGQRYVEVYDALPDTEVVAIAARVSALRDAASVALPLEDRSPTLYPTRCRWLGGDQAGRAQTPEEARSMPLFPRCEG